ncbi:SH3 domain-containing protein [bacterium]|nr:SH3 domain-containing protein [bacterium]
MKKTLVIALLLLSTLAFGFFEDIVETFEPAPLISPEPIYAYVAVDALNLRDAPSTEGEKIGLLRLGDMVELIRWNVSTESDDDSDYLWAEVVSEGQRGYLAAVRLDSYYDETIGVTIPDTTYLRFQHDVGQEELSAEFDLDGDGSAETITARLGELKLGMIDDMYDRNYRYYLPVELTINGSRRLTHRLGEIDITWLTEPAAPEELIPDSHHGWCTFYEFDFADVNGDGRVDIGLNYSHFPVSMAWQRGYPDQRVWRWFSIEDDDLRSILYYTEYLNEPLMFGIDDGGWQAWGWQWDNRFSFTPGGAELLLTVTTSPDLPWDDYFNRKVITASEELSIWNTVAHTLTPPNYLDDCRSYTSNMRLKFLEKAGCYVLDCPPGNRYGMWSFKWLSNTADYLLELAGGPIPLEDEWRYEWQTEEVYRSFELYNHPGGEVIYEVPVGSYMRYQAYELDGQVWSIGITEDDMTGWLLGRPSDES